MISEMQSQFSVIVTATMSSGKSTMLNAMLGTEILPTKNEACTAKVFRIEDVDGIEQVRGRVKDCRGVWSEWMNIDLNHLLEWNEIDISEIEVQGDFPYIDNHKEALSIMMYDTPGPNNAQDLNHAEITTKILKNSDYSFIVCVMNATQFGTEDETRLLEKILSQLKDKNKKTSIVFVLNKIDALDIEAGEKPQHFIRTVKKHLRQIGYHNPVVIPAMSALSLEIRKVLHAKSTGQEIPLSNRAQKRLIAHFELLQTQKKHYMLGLLASPRYKMIYERACRQKRNCKKRMQIEIAGQQVTVSDLVQFDIMTGIPFVEEFLELELIKYHKQNIINRAKAG